MEEGTFVFVPGMTPLLRESLDMRMHVKLGPHLDESFSCLACSTCGYLPPPSRVAPSNEPTRPSLPRVSGCVCVCVCGPG